MTIRVVFNEFAKMRRRRVGLIALLMALSIFCLALYSAVSNPDFKPDSDQAWLTLLAGMSLGSGLISPLLLSVLASRQTDIEHHGQGWLMQSANGVTPGKICRAKLVALGVIVTTVTVTANLAVLVFGRVVAGISVPPPVWQWSGFTLCLTIVNLAILALHVALSAKVENQLVALGIGVFGCVVAVFSQGLPTAAAHLTPWGYYSLASAAQYQGEELVALSISYPSIAVLAVVVGMVFIVTTVHFDRQEL